jgi:hypothetical protein
MLVKTISDDDGPREGAFFRILQDRRQRQGGYFMQDFIVHNDNIRRRPDRFIHEGQALLHVMSNIPKNNEPVDYEIFFAAQAIQQSLLGCFISAYYSQFDHLLPPGNIHIAGVPSAKLNPQKTLLLKIGRLVYA